MVHLEEAKNFGDVMRELETRSVLKYDFLTVRGDVVTNINIHDALWAHY